MASGSGVEVHHGVGTALPCRDKRGAEWVIAELAAVDNRAWCCHYDVSGLIHPRAAPVFDLHFQRALEGYPQGYQPSAIEPTGTMIADNGPPACSNMQMCSQPGGGEPICSSAV